MGRPVTYRDSSEARNSTALAMSRGSMKSNRQRVQDPEGLAESLAVAGARTPEHVVLDHRRVNRAGMHGVDPDVVRGQLVHQRPHQPDHGVLGGGVVREPGESHEAADGADQDERATRVLLDELRRQRLDRLPHPGEVHVHDVLPVALGEFPRGTCADDARVRHTDVDVATFLHPFGHDRGERGGVPYVNRTAQDLATGLFHEPYRGGEVVRCRHGKRHAGDLVADVGRDDARALLREPQGVSPSLPACRTR